jgi:hypothetical protein
VHRRAEGALACLAVVVSSVSAYGRTAYVKSHVKHAIDKKPVRFLVKVSGKYVWEPRRQLHRAGKTALMARLPFTGEEGIVVVCGGGRRVVS